MAVWEGEVRVGEVVVGVEREVKRAEREAEFLVLSFKGVKTLEGTRRCSMRLSAVADAYTSASAVFDLLLRGPTCWCRIAVYAEQTRTLPRTCTP